MQLARVFGIRIGASPSWFFVLFLIIYFLSGYFNSILDVSNGVAYAVAVAGALLFFASLALHELGHALVARRNGIGVVGIDLYVFGGMAKLSRDSATPGEEFRIAAAGPAVTCAVAVGCLLGVGVLTRFGDTADIALGQDTTTPVVALLAYLGVINALLLAVNLVPGFPLDGARMARAIAWRLTGDRNRATRFTARIGQAFAYVLIGLAIWLVVSGHDVGAGLWLGLMGWFISAGSRNAVFASAFSERIEGVTAADLMDSEPVALPGATTAIAAQDEFFLRYRLPWLPVVDPAGRLLGLVRQERVDVALSSGQPTLTAGELLDEAVGPEARVPRDTPLESLLGSEPLRRLGGLMVVDSDDHLCGVITMDRIRRALSAIV